MSNKQELEEKHMKYQMIVQQIKQLQQQLEALEQQLMEVTIAKQSLAELENTEIGTEILTPISSGIFLKAELKNNSDLILNVGANTAVAKNIKDAQKIVDMQLSELRKVYERMATELQKGSEQAQKLAMEINQG